MFAGVARNVDPYLHVHLRDRWYMMNFASLDAAGGPPVEFPRLVGRAYGHAVLDTPHEAQAADGVEEVDGWYSNAEYGVQDFQHFVARIVEQALATRSYAEPAVNCERRESRYREVQATFDQADDFRLTPYVVVVVGGGAVGHCSQGLVIEGLTAAREVLVSPLLAGAPADCVADVMCSLGVFRRENITLAVLVEGLYLGA